MLSKSQKGIVYKHTGSHYLVKDEASGHLLPCTVSGKLRLHDSQTTNPIAAGDRVQFEPTANAGVIKEIYARKNYIIRRSSNLSKQAHIIAANVDKAFLIITIEFPRVSLEFVDRFLVTCEAYAIPASIVVNKIDGYTDGMRQRLARIEAVYAGAGYAVLPVSAKTGAGVGRLADETHGALCLFAGQSGVGKSSLINAIDPSLRLRTGPISDYHRKGMHTTTFYEIFDTASGGHIIDSPGIKGFGLIDVEKAELCHFFPELFRHAAHCKFNMCTHTHEPGCAVKAAVANGQIAPERYTSYLKMRDDDGGKYR
ncbi:MAG: ribosome small subunit-dependent GTPase A [Prevotellaceae bacterium]|jgi:ribosome biogenesis GTPase|nr:ribosome small subunit-dependent GTPase A [Prevotellaceae bacterium]